ncbi:MAG TPA: amidohydrolase family protein, partial [bacterium]|nr:amidohydrolase family protein [bacterium]
LSDANLANSIRAAFRVADGINPSSMLIPVARMEGITSAVSRPESGLVSGQAAWIHLEGRRVEDMILEAPLALFGALDEGGKAFGGNSRSGELRKLREAFEDARFLRSREAALDENRIRSLAASRLDLEALWPVIDRRIPFVIRAQRASDIETALRFARDQKIRIVIEGGAEAWEVADELAAAKVPVILKAMTDLPSSFESLGSRFDNAAKLDAAGVQIAITTEDTHNVRTLRQEAGIAAAWGLPRDRALAAITRGPADIFGMNGRLGTIAKGKTADLVVWSGDPLELSTQPVSVWIDGKDVPMRSRQTDLLDRYRTLPPTR